MKTITVLTATRAEYGLLSPVIHKLLEWEQVEVKVVVTGAHLSPEFGLTYREIEKDGIEIDKKVEILLSSDTPASISKSMGMAMIGFADYFAESRPDALLVLGDRYETLAVCCAAMNARIPIIHLYGGETTEGAVDEAIRHAITKMSYLHLTSTEAYRKRVIQLGEDPGRVYTVGSIGVENALHRSLMQKSELEKSLTFSLDQPYAVVTFHPVTLEKNDAEMQFGELLNAFDINRDMKYIFTKANADSNGRIINQKIDLYTASHENVIAVDSLGVDRYLSALKYAEMVIGNSSSGLVEAPSFKIPTINIGDRQKGRLKAGSVIDCKPDCEEICEAMKKARTSEFREDCRTVVNPYGDGNTTEKILAAIREQILEKEVELKKKFYDLDLKQV